jgi:hypothetical protein
MSDVERLLAEYKQLHRAGGDADPSPFLARTSGVEREQLAALIDAYLERAPRREFDAAAFRDSPAAAVADSAQRTLAGSAGLWPVLLPRLRNQARIRRADLVAELAARLGAQSQQEKVASYYHEMEQGRLPASGVSDTVLEALGKIVGYGKAALRSAGEMPAPGGPPPEAGAVYARTTPRPGAHAAEAEAPAAAPTGPEEWDEVDRLFRAG